jgi:hypothetical protein
MIKRDLLSLDCGKLTKKFSGKIISQVDQHKNAALHFFEYFNPFAKTSV